MGLLKRTYTDEKLKKMLRKPAQRTNDDYKKSTNTHKNAQKVFRKLRKTEDTDAYYRIAKLFMELAEEDAENKGAFLFTAQLFFEYAYKRASDECSLEAEKMLKKYFNLLELTREDGSPYLFYLLKRSLELSGETYFNTKPLSKKNADGLYYFVAKKDENGTVSYRYVVGEERSDVLDAWKSSR